MALGIRLKAITNRTRKVRGGRIEGDDGTADIEVSVGISTGVNIRIRNGNQFDNRIKPGGRGETILSVTRVTGDEEAASVSITARQQGFWQRLFRRDQGEGVAQVGLDRAAGAVDLVAGGIDQETGQQVYGGELNVILNGKDKVSVIPGKRARGRVKINLHY